MTEKGKVITRFPPSPTGFLHIGRARTALFNYLFTRKNGGEMIFRLEDTDQARSTKKFEDNIIESLAWLGISYDQGPFRQSERTEMYKKYLKQIIDAGLAYTSIETDPNDPKISKEVIRFKNPNKKVQFSDLVRGEIEFDTTDLKDFVIARNINDPLYHFTVVVDDFEMGVTHVIRGDDHISNTPRQILIQEAIDAPRPIYAHIPLILAPDRSKLSGRHGAVGVTEYRELGYLPEALINYLALLGWNPGTDKEVFTMEELTAEFDFSAVQKGGAIFDLTKLKWLNKEHMKLMPEDKFEMEVMKYLSEEIKTEAKFSMILPKILPLIKERISTFGEIKEMAEKEELQYFFSMPEYAPESLLCPPKFRKDKVVDLSSIKAILSDLKALIEPLKEDFDQSIIKDTIWPYAEERGRGIVLWAMRYALSGQEKSPDPFTLASVIGKTETLKRLENAIQKIK